MVDLSFALGLLRAHVRGRTEERTFPGQAHGLRVGCGRLVELRQAEIHDLDDQPALFVLGQENVFGLQIAVHHVRFVGLGQAACGVRGDAHGGVDVDLSHASHQIIEALAFEQLHHQEGPLLEHARVVHVADVGAANGGCGARLADEPLAHDARRDQLRGEDFDRHALTDIDVLGFVHGRHPATADLFGDSKLALEDCPDRNLRLILRRH